MSLLLLTFVSLFSVRVKELYADLDVVTAVVAFEIPRLSMFSELLLSGKHSATGQLIVVIVKHILVCYTCNPSLVYRLT